MGSGKRRRARPDARGAERGTPPLTNPGVKGARGGGATTASWQRQVSRPTPPRVLAPDRNGHAPSQMTSWSSSWPPPHCWQFRLSIHDWNDGFSNTTFCHGGRAEAWGIRRCQHGNITMCSTCQARKLVGHTPRRACRAAFPPAPRPSQQTPWPPCQAGGIPGSAPAPRCIPGACRARGPPASICRSWTGWQAACGPVFGTAACTAGTCSRCPPIGICRGSRICMRGWKRDICMPEVSGKHASRSGSGQGPGPHMCGQQSSSPTSLMSLSKHMLQDRPSISTCSTTNNALQRHCTSESNDIPGLCPAISLPLRRAEGGAGRRPTQHFRFACMRGGLFKMGMGCGMAAQRRCPGPRPSACQVQHRHGHHGL